MTFQPTGAGGSQRHVLGEGREAAVTVHALEHYIENCLLVDSSEA